MTTQELHQSDMTIPRRRAGLLAIPALSTAFGFVGGFTIDEHVGTTAFGLIWGLAVMPFAPRLARLGARSTAWANAPVYLMLPLAFIVLGGSILGHLAGPNPTSFLQLLDQPGYPLFFYALHGPFEWLLMPMALIVNWHHPARRRLLIAAAIIFYIGRCASALYFAPNALVWAENPPAAGQLDEVALWIHLDLIRLVLQDTLNAALLLAAALHHKINPSYAARRRVNAAAQPA